MPQDEPTPPPPPDGRDPSAGALDTTIALLSRGIRPDGSYEGVPEGEIAGHQWRILGDCVKQGELIVSSGLEPDREGGIEHDIVFSNGRWLKFTKPFCAGFAVEVVDREVLMLPATPLQYLQRWKAANIHFGDSVEFVGVSTSQETMRLVISQPDVVGEAPTWPQLHQAFTSDLGYKQIRVPGKLLGGYESRSYFQGRIGIFDVRPPNCVITASGVVVPIDVIIQVFSRSDSNVLQALTIDGEAT